MKNNILQEYSIRNTYLLLLCLLTFFLITSCQKEKISDQSKFSQVLDAMGGQNQLNAIEEMSYLVTGIAYEHEENEPFQDSPKITRSYEYELTTKILGRKLRMDYTNITSQYPFEFNSDKATFIINDQAGTVSGKHDLGSVYFGQVAASGLHSPRIEAFLKNYTMSNPVELIKRLAESITDLESSTVQNKFELPTAVEGLRMNIHIDPDNNLPTKVSVLESDFLHGDVEYTVEFNNWLTSSGIKYPTKLKYLYNNNTLKEEDIDQINLNPYFTETHFDIENKTELIGYDPDFALKGILHTQWYERFAHLGIPIDIPLNYAAVVKDQWVANGLPDQTISADIKIIGRPDLQYWCVALNTAEGVVIVDAPLNQEYMQAVIAAVKSEAGFPDTKIDAAIVTHSHMDHFGGIRELAAEAGKVYVNASGTKLLDEIIKANFSLKPDRLATEGNIVSMKSISNITKLDNGKVEIHAISPNDGITNPHSDDMLLVYIPEEKLIIQADLFNAGAMLALFAGQGAEPLANSTIASWRLRARFLLAHIDFHGLDVERVVGMHGGVAPISMVKFVAQL